MEALIVLLYVAALFIVAFMCIKKTKILNDFFLGDRSVGLLASAIAYGTTYFLADLFIGYAGKVGWGFGLSSLWIMLSNTFMGSFLAWKVQLFPE